MSQNPNNLESYRQIQAADSRIRGVLGENFLAHFDLLLDYGRKLLCLDETSAMRESVRGEHIPLVPPQDPESELPFTERLAVSVHLSGAGTRPILLQLDSGSDGPIHARREETKLRLLERATLQGDNVSKAQQAFAVLPPQDMRIGSRTLSRVSFVTPLRPGSTRRRVVADPPLPTRFHQRFRSLCGF